MAQGEHHRRSRAPILLSRYYDDCNAEPRTLISTFFSSFSPRHDCTPGHVLETFVNSRGTYHLPFKSEFMLPFAVAMVHFGLYMWKAAVRRLPHLKSSLSAIRPWRATSISPLGSHRRESHDEHHQRIGLLPSTTLFLPTASNGRCFIRNWTRENLIPRLL